VNRRPHAIAPIEADPVAAAFDPSLFRVRPMGASDSGGPLKGACRTALPGEEETKLRLE
jgi:hypothetical protein